VAQATGGDGDGDGNGDGDGDGGSEQRRHNGRDRIGTSRSHSFEPFKY
jgi:hypothetical protein